MKFFGLTGGIASGKSTASRMFVELGAHVLDADAIYHDLIAPGPEGPSPLAAAIANAFPGVLRKDGSIDRGALGPKVFGNPEALERLGAITHPAVAQEVAARVSTLAEQGLEKVIYDVPLLYERGLQHGMNGVAVVWVPREVQVERLMARDGIDAESAERKIDSQMSLDEKKAQATWTIDNSGSRDETRDQAKVIWEHMNA